MEGPLAAATWPHRSLLAALPRLIREEMIRAGTGVSFGPGDVLLSEGAHDRHAFLLMSGFVKVTATLENGQEALLSVRVGGDLIGEMAAVDGAPRSATVTACGQLAARVLQPAVVTDLMARGPEVAMALTRSVSDQLRWANRRRLDFGGYPVKVRLARLLVELAEVYGHPEPRGVVVGCRLTQPEIATLTGAAETTIHKALRELREQGLLETGYRSTVIRDLAQLKLVGELVEG